MKYSKFITGAMAAVPAMALAQQAQQPNIIMFLVDDMGWQETSVPFWREASDLNRRYRTPNMERLARMGVKFTDAYSCAISSPSRCSLMTGMAAPRHRVTNWTSTTYGTKTDQAGGPCTMPDWNINGIQPEGVTKKKDLRYTTVATPLPQVLKNNGYYTIHCGKAHFATPGTTGADPLSFGFDVNIAGGTMGSPGSYLAQDNYGSGAHHVPGLDDYYAQGTFLTEALTLEAIKAMQVPIDEGKPFYLYMSQYAIHTPYNPDSRFTANYCDADGQGIMDAFLGERLSDSEVNHAALIEGMDKSLGDLLDFLEGQSDDVKNNTIILFMADNGGQGVSPRQGRLNRDQNYPARGGKGCSYEGGVHEPMMVYWPGVTEGGTTCSNRVMIEDFYPSIIEMAGVTDYQTVQTVDGVSFVDLIKDPTLERDRTVVWNYPNRWGESQDTSEGYGAYAAIMKGDYHMIYFWETQERRLYNIREDIGEKNNLATLMPELTMEMAHELTEKLKEMDAQRPTITATGEPVPWPEDGQQAQEAFPSESIFKVSTSQVHHLYTIRNRRSEQTPPATKFYWTRGIHNGQQTIQCTAEAYSGTEQDDQLFYFIQAPTSHCFYIYTAAGEPLGFREGMTCASSSIALSSNPVYDTKMEFVQYGVDTPDEFELVESTTTDSSGIPYCGWKADGQLLNDRGTSKAGNMKWVVAPYSGNSLSDNGSLHQFTYVRTDGEDAIQELSAPTSEAAIYDLQGRRVANPTHGLYIVNGQKLKL